MGSLLPQAIQTQLTAKRWPEISGLYAVTWRSNWHHIDLQPGLCSGRQRPNLTQCRHDCSLLITLPLTAIADLDFFVLSL